MSSRQGWASAPASPTVPRHSVPYPAGPSNPRPVPSRIAQPKPSPSPSQTQPTTVKLCPAGLRNLPYRLTHPPAIPPELCTPSHTPPPAGPTTDPKGKAKAHWWSWDLAHWGIHIQPYYEVSLDDVLDRKHLPPLGLKDFEEWLLFVEGTAENLYFILWLREYTARYDAWVYSLKSLRRTPSHTSTHRASYRTHEDGLAFSFVQPNTHHPPHPHRPGERPYASLGLAMSTLSLPAPGNHSQSSPASPVARRASHAVIHPHHEEDVLDELPSERQLRPYAPSPPPLPPPNPSLALFYLRAKETFLAPNAPYELDVWSEVLGGFFIGSASESGKYRREDDMSPYAPLRNLSLLNLSTKAGLGGKLPPPPDPAVFAELKDIVEDRLKASLARLVVATYNNVGMSRAYCGNAGGVVIGTITSAPPLIASFSLGASRWYRVLALPGMWLGMTIFISALYGVCMMIYIFGDLRQLRSFELARPAISQPKLLPQPPKDDPNASTQQRSQSQIGKLPTPTAVTFSNPFPTSSPYTLAANISTNAPATSLSSRKASLPATSSTGNDAPRKMSLPAVLSGLGLNRSKERVTGNSGRNEEEERLRDAMTPLTRPPVLGLPLSSSTVAERRGSERRGSVGLRPPPLTIVPPEPAYVRSGRDRMAIAREEVSPLERLPAEDVESVEDEGYTSSESFESESDSDDDDDEDIPPDRASPNARAKRRKTKKHRRPLVIEVSDAFYDEHPSPEGPATAPADWFISSVERRSATEHTNAGRRGSVVPTSNPTNPNPLWPDYEGSAEGHAVSDEDGQQTAVFIRPFKYGESDIEDVYICRPGVGREGDRALDVEKGLGTAAASARRNFIAQNNSNAPQEVVPKEEFDFDGLPPPQLKLRTECLVAETAEQQLVYHRPPSPAPSASTRSDLGSAIDRRGRCWLVKRWWWVLEKMQRRCSPENVVGVLKRRSQESMREEKGKGKERERVQQQQPEKCVRSDVSPQEPSSTANPEQAQQPQPQPQAQTQPSSTEKSSHRPRRSQRPKHPKQQPPKQTQAPQKGKLRGPSSWRTGLHKVYLAVPAFAAPLTPVLNPLVGRAQWEIVVRSAAMALVISLVVVGGLVGVPE